MREFTELYNKIDVLLLTDIMDNYRDVSLRHYNLDPLHYNTTPGFAWSAMLRKTGVELELFRDTDMHLMFEKAVRGGLSYVALDILKQIINILKMNVKMKNHQRNIS